MLNIFKNNNNKYNNYFVKEFKIKYFAAFLYSLIDLGKATKRLNKCVVLLWI